MPDDMSYEAEAGRMLRQHSAGAPQHGGFSANSMPSPQGLPSFGLGGGGSMLPAGMGGGGGFSMGHGGIGGSGIGGPSPKLGSSATPAFQVAQLLRQHSHDYDGGLQFVASAKAALLRYLTSLSTYIAGSGLSYNPFSTRSDPVLMQRSRTAYAQMEHEAAEAAAAQAPMLAPVFDDNEYEHEHEHYDRRAGAGGAEAELGDPVGRFYVSHSTATSLML